MTKRPLIAIAVAASFAVLSGCAGTYSKNLQGSYATSYKRGAEALRANDAERAAEHFEFAASSGHPKALIAYGRLFAKGQGVDRDPVRALALFEEAHGKNSALKDRAALELGQLLLKGGDGPSGKLMSSGSRAEAYLLEALNGGQRRAAASLGRIYEQGLDVEPDAQKAIDFYRQAPANDAHAAKNLARLLLANGGTEEEIANAAGRAVSAFEARAKAGKSGDWVQLAELFSRNEIVKVDPERAKGYLQNVSDPKDTAMQMRLARIYQRIDEPQGRNRMLRLAADAGDIRAQTQLAKLFLKPRTDDTNGAVGRYYAERAISRGSQASMVYLGLALVRGDVLEPDPNLGETLLRRASREGHLGGTVALGASILEGNVPERVPEEGKTLLRTAISEGSSDAMSTLGFAYLTGRGVPKDEIMALKWLEKAAEAGNRRAKSFLDDRSGA